MTQQGATDASRSGAFNGMLNEMLTAGRLVFDGRVPFTLKMLLPVAAVIYWIWPLDLMPGLPFDDVAVLLIALHFFVQFANQAIDQHTAGTAQSNASGNDKPVDTVDTTWRVIE